MANQNIISYTSKTYQNILQDMVNSIPLLTDKWINYSEDDPGIVLLKLIAATADMLCYNMDFQALENFPQKALNRSNAQHSYDLINYKMKWYQSATGYINLEYVTEIPSAPRVIIPNYTQVQTTENTSFIIVDSSSNRTLYPNTPKDMIVIQGVPYNISGISSDYLGEEGKIWIGYQKVDCNHLYLTSHRSSDGVEVPEYAWTQVDDLDTTMDPGRYFQFKIDNKGNPYVQLCPNFSEYMNSVYLKLTYIQTDGYDGNIGKNTLDKFSRQVFSSDKVNLTPNLVIHGNSQTLNGANPETLSSAFINAKKHSSVLDSAVTISDFETLAETVVGVRKCRVLEINLTDDNLVFFDTFEDFPYYDEDTGKIMISNGGSPAPYFVSYRNLYVDSLSELCYRLSVGTDGRLTYERVDLLLQLITTDFTNPLTTTESLIDAVLSTKKVFCINPGYSTGYTDIIPYNVIIYCNEPYSEALRDEIIESINGALNNFYVSGDREFGEFVKYTDTTQTISSSNSKIQYVDIIHPKGNHQCPSNRFPRLGPVCINLSDDTNLALLDTLMRDSINGYCESDGSTSSLTNRSILNTNLFAEVVSLNSAYSSTKYFYLDPGQLPYEGTHYLYQPVGEETPAPITLTSRITLYTNSKGQILVNSDNTLYDGHEELGTEVIERTLDISWYSSREDIVHYGEMSQDGNYSYFVEDTKYLEKADIKLIPILELGTCKFSLDKSLNLIKDGIYDPSYKPSGGD